MTTTEIKTIKPGGGGDYPSLNAWNTAEATNLVTADKIKVAEVYSGGNALTGTLNLNGWTTDATRYIEIRAASGHEHTGVWDTNKAYGSINVSSGRIYSNAHTRLTKMQFSVTNPGNDWPVQNYTNSMIIDRCFWKLNSNSYDCLYMNGPGSVIKNSIVLCLGNQSWAISVGAGTCAIYNNTVINFFAGPCLSYYGGTTTTDNNYWKQISSSYVYSARGGTLVKGAKDATSNTEATDPVLRSIPYSTATFQVVTAGSENLRLVVSGSNKLLDHGSNLTAQGVTEDIIGTIRPQFGTFDIGAFENDIPVCWNYTARYKDSNKLFKASGCGNYPKSLRVPNNIDKSTGRMIDDGVEIDPSEYEVI